MRGSGWVLSVVVGLLWVATVGYPGAALLAELPGESGTGVEMTSPTQRLLTTTIWAAAVAIGAAVVGWAPGRVLGRALHGRRYLPLAVLMLAPICVPAYVVFYAWYQSWPPTSAVFRWAVATDHMGLIKAATLWLGLTCWSWPLVAWCVAGVVASTPAQRLELLAVDGAGVLRRALDRLRCDAPGLLVGAGLVFLMTFNNTTSFDLADIFSYGNELRAISASGGNTTDLLTAAWPAIGGAFIGAFFVWVVVARRAPLAGRVGRGSSACAAVAVLIWVVSVLVPVVIYALHVAGGPTMQEFIRLYGRAVVSTGCLALLSGGLGIVIAVGLTAIWQDDRPCVRILGHILAVGWFVAALVPGTVVGVAIEAAYNRPVLDDLVYAQPVVLIGGYVARFAFVGALLARWAAASEPTALRDLRRLDGAQSLGGLLAASWPRYVAAAGATGAIVTVLSLSEIPVTASLHPPGSDPLAVAVLAAMHYQRPYTVMLFALALLAAALLAALVAVGVWRPLRRFGSTAALIGLSGAILLGPTGCSADDPDSDHAGTPLKTRLTFGSTGSALGQFNYPRGIAVDQQRRWIYIVDKTARVQRFSFDGEPQLQWRMPQRKNGKPVGLNVAPDGRIFVADTHYHRVIAYDSEGHELMRFGRYGMGPGEFIYPTDIAFGPQGRIYVSEYGGNDRVQVFTADGQYLFAFGSFGSDVGQFNRPQAMTFNPQLTELYIGDACNHRIVVVDPQGNLLRVLGRSGRGLGELAYPYDVVLLGDGSVLVCEFGNSRIQRLSPTGECRGVYGRVGTEEGQLRYPWGIDGTAEEMFVLDSGNNRVQMIRTPR